MAFNYNDHTVQLRLLALAMAILLIVCLGIWELSTHAGKRKAAILLALMVLSSLTVAYVLAVLGGIW